MGKKILFFGLVHGDDIDLVFDGDEVQVLETLLCLSKHILDKFDDIQ